VAHVDPDQEAALRRLRAAFGFVEVLEVVDHHPSEDPAGDQEPRGDEDEDQAPPIDSEEGQLAGSASTRRNTTRSYWSGRGGTSS
jgi:hypothetical protein